jgi:hypothetical protein
MSVWAASSLRSGRALVAGKSWPATGAAFAGRPASPPVRVAIAAAEQECAEASISTLATQTTAGSLVNAIKTAAPGPRFCPE